MDGSYTDHPCAGLRIIPGWLDRRAQETLLAELRELMRDAPLYCPRMPRSNRPFSVQMTNCGALGWCSDVSGYRYQTVHPMTGRAWPPMPAIVIEAWRVLADYPAEPEACLVNYYDASARMGLHQDRDELDLRAPVLSLSLGDSCVFRIGGRTRKAPTRAIRLASGDAIVLGGAARLAFHGVDRILAGTSSLLPEGGRFNLTLRRVTTASDGDSPDAGHRPADSGTDTGSPR